MESKKVQARMPQKTFELLEKYAKKNGLNISEFLRFLIHKYDNEINEKKEG